MMDPGGIKTLFKYMNVFFWTVIIMHTEYVHVVNTFTTKVTFL